MILKAIVAERFQRLPEVASEPYVVPRRPIVAIPVRAMRQPVPVMVGRDELATVLAKIE